MRNNAHSFDVVEGKILPRSGFREGQFASRKAAEEFARNGRVHYRGKYRTHEEIAVYLAESSPWKGADVERTPKGWTFTLGTAVLHLADPFPRVDTSFASEMRSTLEAAAAEIALMHPAGAEPVVLADVIELHPDDSNKTQIACMGCLVPGHPHGCGRKGAA